MKYFDLADDRTISKRWHVGEILTMDGTEPPLIAGLQLDATRSLYADVHYMGRVLEYCLSSFGVPIATRALADAIRSAAQADLQCIPVTISGQSGMVVLNALRVIRCVNEQRSEFIKWTEQHNVPEKVGQYRQVTDLVLSRDAIPPDAHFFRVDGWRIALIVSEVVKNAMERVGCYGAQFTALEVA